MRTYGLLGSPFNCRSVQIPTHIAAYHYIIIIIVVARLWRGRSRVLSARRVLENLNYNRFHEIVSISL